jgi:outer membrane protein TolC
MTGRRRWVAWLPLIAAVGCTSADRPDNGIRGGLPQIPVFVHAQPSTSLPVPPDAKPQEAKKDEPKTDAVPPAPPGGVLTLEQVLASVDAQFPLLLATVLDRDVADGQVLTAEGQFDTTLRSRAVQQAGTFPNTRYDIGVEQPTAVNGINLFSGYRVGVGDYPVYYGDRQTADGGELRAGILLPLLRDAAVDRRRATARQAAVTRLLAEPGIQRARIDYHLAAARAYWNWVAAAEQVRVAQDLLRLAAVRQSAFDKQFKEGQREEFSVIDNRRLVAEREGEVARTERVYQAAALDLSQYVRDANGDPVVPPASAAPTDQPERTDDVPDASQLPSLVEAAGRQRPELLRLALQKERLAVDIKLAENQTLPGLNLTLAGAQDMGNGKRTTGSSALDRSNLEAGVQFEVPLQRRDPLGRLATAKAQMAQLVRQEQFARDRIQIEIQDALANLDRTRVRIEKAREELTVAERVAKLELTRFEEGQTNLLEFNIRELTAAGARSKVVDAVAEFRRARAALRAAVGDDARR